MNTKALAEALSLPTASSEQDILNAVRNLIASHDLLAAEKRSSGTVQKESRGVLGQPIARTKSEKGQATVPEQNHHLDPATLESIWHWIRARASEDPIVLQVLAEKPELRVTIHRKTLEASAANLRGSLGILISEKFFDQPTESANIRAELIRRGFLGQKAPNLQIFQALQGLVELGFLTKEESGYQAVPGMKVHITEARA
jgi:hypothetical protein